MYPGVSKLRIFALVLALFGLIALSTGLAYGQAISGSLVGTVIDSSSAVVNSATVEATNLGTGSAVTVRTTGTGVGAARSVSPRRIRRPPRERSSAGPVTRTWPRF